MQQQKCALVQVICQCLHQRQYKLYANECTSIRVGYMPVRAPDDDSPESGSVEQSLGALTSLLPCLSVSTAEATPTPVQKRSDSNVSEVYSEGISTQANTISSEKDTASGSSSRRGSRVSLKGHRDEAPSVGSTRYLPSTRSMLSCRSPSRKLFLKYRMALFSPSFNRPWELIKKKSSLVSHDSVNVSLKSF